MTWKFKHEKAEQTKRYAQTHQKTVEVAVEKKVPYEKCENCDRTAYQKAKEKCDNRKIQLEKKYKNMTTGYESIVFLLAWYSIATTIYFGEWIKSGIPINLIALLLVVHVVYIGIRCYVKDWREERGYY